MNHTPLLPLAAIALDMALGDPNGWPHPVRLIGWALDRLETLLHPTLSPTEWVQGETFSRGSGAQRPARAPGAARAISPVFKRLYGLCVAISLSLGVWFLASLLIRLPGLGWLFSLYLAFAGLALGQLMREAGNVSKLLESGRLEDARRELSFLVSRDTSALDEPGLWRTLAETVSENYCDAFVAPFFYLCLGGAPLLWLYKTVSTMDSMWGYKTERFVDLGWAGARADDALAFLPARLAACSLLAAGLVLGLPVRLAWANFRRDAQTMASPNAGWPMASAAWLCGASMGGRAVYFGSAVEKPPLGPVGMLWDTKRFSALVRLICYAQVCIMVLFPVAALVIFGIFS
jgi:adenosylcobinamide-phosphate synthase